MCSWSQAHWVMALEESLEAVRYAMRNRCPRAPGLRDRVYKDECMFSFDDAFTPGGLYINLSSWQAFGADYVTLDQERTGNSLYLHDKRHKVNIQASACTAWLQHTFLLQSVPAHRSLSSLLHDACNSAIESINMLACRCPQP